MINLLDAPIANETLPDQRALHIGAEELDLVLRNGTRILSGVTLCVEPGELVAVIGASGAGKTTLLQTLAGLRRPSSGQVRYDGWELERHVEAFRGAAGYVPQDDIIHRDLPVRATLRHAARLRLPHLAGAELDEVVDRTLATLGLTDRASTTVARLSGGQRKRVSIAVELLTRPRAFFLDEPTSGLDPGTARNLLATLRTLADDGSTVVLTTHNPDDVGSCDRVVVVGRGGRLVFHGTPAGALAHFGVSDLAEVYRRLDDAPAPPPPPIATVPPTRTACATDPTGDATRPATTSSAWHQWKVLCRRNVDVLARNRLTLAIMLGTPALVIAMFVVLFRSNAFDAVGGDPSAAVGTTYWLAFAAFFFGLTYGLLQVVTEMAIVRRERHVGLRPGAYLLAKLAVLVPVLLAVNAGMVAALQLTGRLPDLGWSHVVTLVALLLLDAVAALALGLLASAAVSDPSHATLALPLLCFPAVLFGGAVLPVQAMAGAGRLISAVTPDRWSFEALGRVLDLDTRFAAGGDGFVTGQHGNAFTGGLTSPSIVVVLFAAAFLAAGVGMLRRKTAVR